MGRLVYIGSIAALGALAVWAALLGGQAGRVAAKAGASSGVGAFPVSAVATQTPVCDPAWSLTGSADPASAGDLFGGVASISESNVWAVGTQGSAGSETTLIENWDGARWNNIPSPNPTPQAGNRYFLNAATAIAANDVWAAGYWWDGYDNLPLLLHWDGAQWTFIPSVGPGGGTTKIFGISGTAGNDVWAVGSYWRGSGFPTQTVTMHWNGRLWSVVPSPNAGNGDWSTLSAVTAVSASDAWAVGYSIDSQGTGHELIMRWNGATWNIAPGARPDSTYLYGVSADSTNDAWAVGYYVPIAGQTRTFIERWNGAQWSAVDSPNLADNNYLFSVDALSANDAWAVGYYRSGGGTSQTLTAHWDGTQWSLIASPNSSSAEENVLYGVSALSGSEVWAVGRFASSSGYRTLAMRYAGAPCGGTPSPTGTPCTLYWREVPNPAGSATLTGVAAISGDDVWAVGYSGSGTSSQTLTMHWNGSAWSLVPSPNLGTSNTLTGVSAVASNDVWAVGNYTNSAPLLYTLHWDGAQWSQIPNPGPGSNYAENLQAVDAVSANDVWAVGFFRRFSPEPLIMHWDGAQWTYLAAAPGGISQLNAVTHISPTDVWAVGGTVSGSNSSVILHWDGSSWTVVGSPDASTLRGVSGTASNDVWAVGGGILHWDGTSWTQVTDPSPSATLYSVAAISSSDAWAVGDAIVRWDGSVWSTVSYPGPVSLKSVSAASAEDLWAVGSSNGQALTLHYSSGCPGPSPTATRTPSASATGTGATSTLTATPSPTGTATSGTPIGTRTAISSPTTPAGTTTTTPTPRPGSPTATVTPCAISFSDVHSSDYFYEPVRYLYCLGAISGYSDGTFRPYNNTTRGQLSKIVVLAEGWAIDTTGGPHFSDVPESNPFYTFIETAYHHGVISGYSDGTFRWGNNVTRAQLTKIVVLAEGWVIDTTGGPHFSDVPETDPFYGYIETAYNRAIISGYADGTFRPGNNATRGQISKIVYSAITQVR